MAIFIRAWHTLIEWVRFDLPTWLYIVLGYAVLIGVLWMSGLLGSS